MRLTANPILHLGMAELPCTNHCAAACVMHAQQARASMAPATLYQVWRGQQIWSSKPCKLMIRMNVMSVGMPCRVPMIALSAVSWSIIVMHCWYDKPTQQDFQVVTRPETSRDCSHGGALD